MSNKLDEDYCQLLKDIINNGVKKKTRNGETLSVFGRSIRHNMMTEGFPLLTTKKMYWKGVVTELIWFLRGDTNIKYLVDNDCHIWDGDAFKNFLEKSEGDPDLIWNKEQFIHKIKTDDEFAKKWGDLGPIYGKQWRDWNGKDNVKLSDERDEKGYLKFKIEHINGIDQIENLIEEIRTNPDSRRLMVSAWNVGQINDMVLPPCHYGFQVYTRELTGEERWDLLRRKVGDDSFKLMVDDIMPFGGGLSEELEHYNIPKRGISLMWNQRSVDTFLGLPFNIASYGLLLVMLADEFNMAPDELIGNLGDTHLYVEHVEGAKEQISRKPYPLPNVKVQDGMYCRSISDIFLENYQSHPPIKVELKN